MIRIIELFIVQFKTIKSVNLVKVNIISKITHHSINENERVINYPFILSTYTNGNYASE